MTERITLRGITWNHTRGLVSVQATAQRFHELHPHVDIVWEKRSLQAFADEPLQELAPKFDLLVIDHPFVGYAAKHKPLLDLNTVLPKAFLADQAAHQVGRSHDSYSFDGGQWALAIDAATPVASWRSDVLEQLRTPPPQTWDEVLDLADRGHVSVAGIPIDSLMNFYTLCIAVGETPFVHADRVVSRETGRTAVALLADLLRRCGPACLKRNPIAVYNEMAVNAPAGQPQLAYCPFAYGYSVYARQGYAQHALTFGNVPSYRDRTRSAMLRSTLGGTGLAISASTKHREACAAYAQFTADPQTQAGIFVAAGGQPGHRAAWLDDGVNAQHRNYFRATLPTLDHSFIRPRYAGYLDFQDHGGPLLHRALTGQQDIDRTLDELDALYRTTQAGARHATA
jgi:multiple sugar transport system substrate-binding protein